MRLGEVVGGPHPNPNPNPDANPNPNPNPNPDPDPNPTPKQRGLLAVGLHLVGDEQRLQATRLRDGLEEGVARQVLLG